MNKLAVLPLTIGISLIALSAPFACGGIFDVACNLHNGGMSPGNVIKQTEKAGQDVGRTVGERDQ
jgi:hypothetical protein